MSDKDKRNYDWLFFNEDMKHDWCAQTAEMLACILDKTKESVTVSLTLPGEADARDAYENNHDLMGRLDLEIEGKKINVLIPLPFDGVFLKQRCGKGAFTASAMVWHSWLGEKPGFRFIKTPSDDKFWRVGLPGGRFIGQKVDKKKLNCKVGIEWLEAFNRYAAAHHDVECMYPDWLIKAKDWKKVHKEACEKCGENVPEDSEDLSHRMLLTFPVWLRIRLCHRVWMWRDKDEASLSSLLSRTLVPFSPRVKCGSKLMKAETGVLYCRIFHKIIIFF